MVVGVLTGRRPVDLIKVPPNVKINAQVYIGSVLKPLVEVNLPELYPGELNKIFIHHDKASSNTAKKVVDYAKTIHDEFGITLISNKEIHVKSPGTSPLDFFGFGYLKPKRLSRRAATLDGLWKVARAEWRTITLAIFSKVFSCPKFRCRAVHKKKGYQIENTNHSKKIRL